MSELARLAIGHLPAFASMWPGDVKIAWFAAYGKLCEACRETGETPPAHPEVSEQSTQDQPTPCEKCPAYQRILKEAYVALRLAHPAIEDSELCRTVLETGNHLAQFLADPQQVERDAAGERGEVLEALANLREWIRQPESGGDCPKPYLEVLATVDLILAEAEGRSNA